MSKDRRRKKIRRKLKSKKVFSEKGILLARTVYDPPIQVDENTGRELFIGVDFGYNSI